MKLTNEFKKEIDQMSYEEMLKEWRFSPLGSKRMQDSSGVYFGKVMAKKRDALPEGKAAAISKQIGWKQ